MKLALIVMLGLIFLAGGLIGLLLSERFPAIPQFQSAVSFGSITHFESDSASNKIEQSVSLRALPKDRVEEKNIKVFPDKIVLEIPHAEWATFADTGSMEPVLFQGANALQIKPSSPDEIQVGDIISYKPDLFNDITLIHRVVKIEGTGENKLFYAQGDTNSLQDPYSISFGQIERVVIAIVY